MKPVLISRILLSVILLLCGNLPAQKNSSHQGDNSPGPANMSVVQTPEKNKEVVRKLYEDILNTGQFELLNQVIAEDYVGSNGQVGPSGFAEPIKALRQGFPNFQWTVEDLIAEGDRVVVKWKWQGVHEGLFQGFKATGKSVTGHGIGIFEIRDSKIVHAWILTDRLGFLQQIGVVPRDLGSATQQK